MAEDQKIGFFQEAENQWSITRLIFFIGMLWAMTMTSIVVWKHPDMNAIDIGLAFSGLSAPFVLNKVGQKLAESKADKPV